MSYIDAEAEEYLELGTYWRLLHLALRKSTKLNILRFLAYPLVKAFLSLRMLIVVVAEKVSSKVSNTETVDVHRW